MTADLGELVATARRRQADPVQMPVDVKVLVVHPDWVVGVEAGIGELFAELGHGLDPQRQCVAQSVERVPAGHG